MSAHVYCTIATADRAYQAKRLRESVRRVDPEASFYVLVLEHPSLAAQLRVELGDQVLSLDQIGCATWLHFAFALEVDDLALAVLPSLIHKLLDLGDVIYLDPTYQTAAAPTELLAGIGSADITAVASISTQSTPHDVGEALEVGPFDKTFLAVRREGAGRKLMAWWRDMIAKDLGHAGRWAMLFPLFGAQIGLREDVLPFARVAAQTTGAISSSFALYPDGTPIPPLHRRAFRKLAPANQRTIYNPFAQRTYFETITRNSIFGSGSGNVAELQRRINELEGKLNSFPYQLIRYANGTLGLVAPKTRDRIYNFVQYVTRGTKQLHGLVRDNHMDKALETLAYEYNRVTKQLFNRR